MTKYWIIVAVKDHVQRGIAGGFAQANHGKAAPLRRMRPGDKVIYYSPKNLMEDSTPYQQFTAIGEVADGDVYQVEVSEDFKPFRRNVRFAEAQDTPIRPLIDELSFIHDKQHWGSVFRFGMLEIPQGDYERIASTMQASS